MLNCLGLASPHGALQKGVAAHSVSDRCADASLEAVHAQLGLNMTLQLLQEQSRKLCSAWHQQMSKSLKRHAGSDQQNP